MTGTINQMMIKIIDKNVKLGYKLLSLEIFNKRNKVELLMFKISESGWNKLDKEMARISNNIVPHLAFLGELFPSSGEINLKATLDSFLRENKDQCNYEFDSHDNHGAVSCDTDVITPLSDFIRGVVAHLSSSDQIFLSSFQAEVTVDGELAGLIYGDAYKGSAILPDTSGKRLQIIELEF
ncbi:MAG: hypothetical protein QXY52_06840 [Conexivisphaerales archaeon]